MVKREDLLHPLWGGNKVYKSARYFAAFRASGAPKILTFGGAYSNHLLAMAAQCHELNIPMVAVVRGEEPDVPSPTLRDLYALGAQCHFVPRSTYRLKTELPFIDSLHGLFGDFFLVPEGGGGVEGSQGCFDWMIETLKQLKRTQEADAICVAVGTGGTCAGILAAVDNVPVHGFLALKGSQSMTENMASQIEAQAAEVRKSRNLKTIKQAFTLETDYHFGGYAKKPDALKAFVESFESEVDMPLDYVYTAKVFFGLSEQLKKGFWPPGTRILVMHTGGLQGNRSN